MNEKIEKIRAALDEIEKDLRSSEGERVLREFSAFELPEIIKDIVDYLIPRMTPYAAAYYWYMFRRSILHTGNQYLRAGTKPLRTGVVRSAH